MLLFLKYSMSGLTEKLALKAANIGSRFTVESRLSQLVAVGQNLLELTPILFYIVQQCYLHLWLTKYYRILEATN